MAETSTKRERAAKHQTSAGGRFEGSSFVAILTALLLIPFLFKPFHVDDTLFVRIAEQIQESPGDPFGFAYNWYGNSMPMGKITQNPPLVCYMLAGVASVTGMHELPLHLALGLVAIATMLLSYAIARHFCKNPTLAVVMTLFTPAFLVSAGNVMAEIPLLFFWMLAIHATLRALSPGAAAWLWVAGVAASAAAMSKYFGVAVMPLVAVFWILRTRRFSLHLLGLFLPIVVLIGWGVYSEEHYDVFHPLGAAEYSVETKSLATINRNFAHSIAFVGLSFLWPVLILLAGRHLPRKTTVALLWLATVCVLFDVGMAYTIDQQDVAQLMQRDDLTEDARVSFTPAVRTSMLYATYNSPLPALFSWGATLIGALMFVVALRSCWLRRDIDTLFLALWFFGTFVFAAFLNWTVNARAVLPALLAAVLLFLRWVETLPNAAQVLTRVKIGLAPVLVVTLLVAAADYEFAASGQSFAREVIRPQIERGKNVYFVGHWGFQYYMEEAGATPLEINGNQFVDPYDLVVYPHNNVNIDPLNLPTRELLEKTYPLHFGLHPMSAWARSGFYSSSFGPLPFGYDSRNICDRYVVEEFLPPNSK